MTARQTPRSLLQTALFVGVASCAPMGADLEPTVEVFDGLTMGTSYSVRVVAETGWELDRRARVGARIQGVLDAIESAMSHYQPTSELSRFNRNRTTEPFYVSRETFEVMSRALDLSAQTGGALDVTVGPLVNAWGFGPDEPMQLPPDADLLGRLRSRVGFEKLELDAAASTLRKTDPELECDLSAVAKGYGVDQVAAALSEEGETRFMVEVGGEIVASGLNQQGRPWRIGIERPSADGGIEQVVPLSDRAMATSGDYHIVREFDGRFVSHTIDPHTGRPVEHQLASVTVIADECIVADGLATALAVLGLEEGYPLASERGWAALFLVRDDDGTITAHATEAFELLGSYNGN